ncbi:putative autophagocytosis associated protein [Tribonema minus]|uniref:Putative autophagocytosis associated protein n=1 Tax=Tribonema minus TaxID=303371 RepID=A0A835YXZ6_9STRA|nr:putative autophagocytosis associated protein [Tribonema minus]
MSSLLSYAKGIRERLAPVRVTSAYQEKGVLTPEEFVLAGDQLVFKCPTWSWEAGDPSKAKPYLPVDKQYLITKGVPCLRRVASLESDYLEETEIPVLGDDDALSDSSGGWLEPKQELELELDGDRDDETAENKSHALASALAAIQLNDDHFRRAGGGGGAEGGYPDLDTFVEDNVVEPDAATLAPGAGAGGGAGGSYMTAEEPQDAIVRTRSYDLSITYDKYYQVPRIWLAGYDEAGAPLSPSATFEDIMQDYARQTVTIEPHPHAGGGAHAASVHPCRHAAVMRRIVANLAAGGGRAARVDQYLFVFLKFIQSVCPTIDYDYTMEIDAMS